MIIYTLPVIAALIGWFTNFIAIKMLFHPKEKVNLILFTIQGIFPKRKGKLAEKLGKVVSEELFSFHDVKVKLEDPDNINEAMTLIEDKIDIFLKEKLSLSMPFLSMFISDDKLDKMKKVLLEEIRAMLPDLINRFSNKIEENLDIEKVVYEKVMAFSSDKLEDLLYSIMKKEFRFIEVIGAVLGFLIGLVQIVLVELSAV